jgi:hypothetical protein
VLVAPSELALVLALECDSLEQGRSFGLHRRVADKLPKVTNVSAEVAPGEDLLAGLANVGTKSELFVEQERLLVLLACCKGFYDPLFTTFLVNKIFFALLVCALDN